MIHFFTEDVNFTLQNKLKTKSWLKQVAEKEGFKVGDLNYIFCSDEYLHKINVEYLAHDTLTDIITFDNAEDEGVIEGDIFISIDRVKDNAKDLGIDFTTELPRVLVHGLLHLCGYDDHSDEDELLMRQKEESYMPLLSK